MQQRCPWWQIFLKGNAKTHECKHKFNVRQCNTLRLNESHRLLIIVLLKNSHSRAIQNMINKYQWFIKLKPFDTNIKKFDISFKWMSYHIEQIKIDYKRISSSWPLVEKSNDYFNMIFWIFENIHLTTIASGKHNLIDILYIIEK
jgi:hypothetical protein